MIDNFKVRVIEWVFDPGDETGQHIYEYDSFVVSIKDGLLKIINEVGSIILSELKWGISYFIEKVKIITLLMKINFTIVL